MLAQISLRSNFARFFILFLLVSNSLSAGTFRKFSISLGYPPPPLSYFEIRKPYRKIGLGLVGVGYNLNNQYSIQLSGRYLISAYLNAGKVELNDTSILTRSSGLIMLQFKKKVIQNNKFTLSLQLGLTNNIERNEYHLVYFSSGDTYHKVFESYTNFGINIAPNIEYNITSRLGIGADLIYSKQFVYRLYQQNILSSSVYFRFNF